MTMLSLTVSILNFLPGGGCTSSGVWTAGTVVLVANLQYRGKNITKKQLLPSKGAEKNRSVNADSLESK
jgi:hypothetical protein